MYKAYIDTSTLGAIFDIEDTVRVTVTNQLLKLLKTRSKFTSYISNIVIEEVDKAPLDIRKEIQNVIKDISFIILDETEECIGLVNEYLKKNIIPKKYRDDARHIAVSVINDMDFIITWNCRHMANIENKRMINGVNMILGYRQIDIVTPMEVVGYG